VAAAKSSKNAAEHKSPYAAGDSRQGMRFKISNNFIPRRVKIDFP
jgi:hypothetical protein